MANWIIEDLGFGGTWYQCSACGRRWNDMYSKVSGLGPCPGCGASIDPDRVLYIEDDPRVSIISPKRAYDELETKLIQLTGFNLEKLVDLFAAGYTLKAPEYKSFNDVLEDVTC